MGLFQSIISWKNTCTIHLCLMLSFIWKLHSVPSYLKDLCFLLRTTTNILSAISGFKFYVLNRSFVSALSRVNTMHLHGWKYAQFCESLNLFGIDAETSCLPEH
jgi:hypothetical protein